MATVVQSMIEPDADAIKAHLTALFEPCAEYYPRGIIELRYGADTPNKSSYFNTREDGIAEAAAFAANRNREGCNVYVGVNPRKPDTRGAAKDADIAVAFWHFADLDTLEAVDEAGRRMKALPPTMTVTTGTEPHRRPHLYWKLEEPVGNLQAWTQRQAGIASHFEGDSVINPSRIMRLAGTVNYPPQHKLARGYRMELCTLRTEFSDDREPVTPEQIAAAYPVRQTRDSHTPTGEQNTLQAMKRTQTGDLLEACRNGDQWHNSMIRLVAHLAATGRTSAEILALADHITLPGYTVDQTLQEMQTALDGARSKYALLEPEGDIEAEEQSREDADAIFELLDMEELENMPPPTWLIHEMVAEEGLTVIYGEPGAGKSFVVLDMALRIAHAMDWHGTASRATGVLYIAGEGVRGLGKRVKGWKQKHDMEGVDAPFLLLPCAVQLLDEKNRAKLLRTITAAKQRAGFDIGLVIVDTVSRSLAGADENGQEAMSAFVSACDAIRQHTGGALVAVHHSGKDKERGMRGSTVLLGGCDASIRIEKSEQLVTLKTEKQKDAEQSEPIYMTMEKVTWAQGLEEEQSTLVPVKTGRPLADERDLSREQIEEIFNMIDMAWLNKAPLSPFPHAKRTGRYAPDIIAQRYEIPVSMAADYLKSWQENGMLRTTEDSHSKAKGLCVMERFEA